MANDPCLPGTKEGFWATELCVLKPENSQANQNGLVTLVGGDVHGAGESTEFNVRVYGLS